MKKKKLLAAGILALSVCTAITTVNAVDYECRHCFRTQENHNTEHALKKKAIRNAWAKKKRYCF